MNEIKKIHSSRCFIDGVLKQATIHYASGKITAVDYSKSPDAIDMGNNIIMPGVIDAHVHVNEPGRTSWEGFETATKAAVAGGITTLADMPLNASPVTTTIDALHKKIQSTEGKLSMNIVFYGGLIPENSNGHLQELLHSGIRGIKCFLVHSGIDEFPNVSLADLEKAMPLIAKSGIPLLAHCEMYHEAVDTGLSKDVGNYSKYLAGRPKKWENDAIQMMVGLSRKYDCPVHIVHVSSADAIPMIAAAKAEGLKITAETCPHYIYFNAEEIPDHATVFKCAPPIREKANNELLKKALAEAVLDFIATDHSPAPPSIKEIESGNLFKAWGGIAGLQFLLSASWTAMKDFVSIEEFIPMLTAKPAQFLQLSSKGEIKEGFDADFTVWSPEDSFLVETKDILHRYVISPYAGRILSGVIAETIVGGETVYKESKVNAAIKPGLLLLRK